MRSSRGTTLVELMMSVAITAIVMTALVAVATVAVRLVRRTEQVVISNDASRLALEGLLRDVRLAGMGAPGGIWVVQGGAPVRINAVFGGPGDGGTDELWLAVPRPNVMSTGCNSAGGSATLTESGTGPLRVTCTAPLADAGTLMVTNFTTGALIDGLTIDSTNNTVDYAQQGVSGFSDAPEKGGFQKGDFIFPVQLMHYFISVGADGRPALVRAQGKLNSAAGAPFIDAGPAVMVSPSVEDLQVAFGVIGADPEPTFQNQFPPAWQAGLRALRITAVGRSQMALSETGGPPSVSGPVTVEDHVPAATIDGLRRSVYRRRVDLLNLDMVNL